MIGLLPLSARYMLLSALGFSLMATCVKLSAERGIPLMEIMLARCIVSLALSYADVRRKGISPWGRNRPLLLARGIVGAIALMCVYFALTQLPLAEATLLQYTHPVFTALLGILLLGEHLHRSTVACLLLSIAGLVIMVAPGLLQAEAANLPALGVGMALLGAFGSGVAYIIVRRLSHEEDASVIILYFPLVALPASAVLLGSDFVLPDATGLALLLMVGVFTQVGQWGLTHAMRHEVAGKATAYSYVQVIFAAILGWLVFGEVPTLATWLGGGLIIAGALVNIGRR